MELLVEHAEIRSRGTRLVQIRVHSHEYAVRALVRTAGGVCDSRTGLWTLPKAVVAALQMTPRIVDRK